MRLHEAIEQVLKEHQAPMSSRELADVINARGLYVRPSDTQPLDATQVAARVRRPEYKNRFRIDSEHRISLA